MAEYEAKLKLVTRGMRNPLHQLFLTPRDVSRCECVTSLWRAYLVNKNVQDPLWQWYMKKRWPQHYENTDMFTDYNNDEVNWKFVSKLPFC